MLDDRTPLTQGQMSDDAAKYEGGQERQGDNEAVEVAVVAFAHAVPHPGTVVVESFWGQTASALEVNTKQGHVGSS